VFNTTELIVGAALAGLGLAWVPRDIVEGHIASRSLISVLDEWACLARLGVSGGRAATIRLISPSQ
jgi:DNA-binding transcriptional LysR family regulator